MLIIFLNSVYMYNIKQLSRVTCVLVVHPFLQFRGCVHPFIAYIGMQEAGLAGFDSARWKTMASWKFFTGNVCGLFFALVAFHF